MQIFCWLLLKLPKKVIKIIKQWIRSFVTLLIGAMLYYVLKMWGYPEQDFIDEVFWTFVFGVIAITITENHPCFFSFSLWNKPMYFERYGSTIMIDAPPNVARLDLPSENQDISNASFKIILPCFSGVDAQYIPILCENSHAKGISKVSLKFEHLTLFSSNAEIIIQQYPIEPKPIIPYINPLGSGETLLLVFQINLNHSIVTELQNGRILLGISAKVNRGIFRQYYLLEFQVFAGKCVLLTQKKHSSFLVFHIDRLMKSRQIETVKERRLFRTS